MSFQERSTYDDWLYQDKHPGKSIRGLSIEEAHRLLQLEYSLDEQRQSCVDYLLVRASFSRDKREKQAWWILMALQLWVERNHRFPRSEELNQYLASFLHGPGVPKLPELFDLDHTDLLEVADLLRMSELVRRRSAKDCKEETGDQDHENIR